MPEGFFSTLAKTRVGTTSKEIEEQKAAHKMKKPGREDDFLDDMRARLHSGASIFGDDEDEETTSAGPTPGVAAAPNPTERLDLRTHYYEHTPGANAAYVVPDGELEVTVIFRRRSNWDDVKFKVNDKIGLHKYIKTLVNDGYSIYDVSSVVADAEDHDEDDDYDYDEDNDLLNAAESLIRGQAQAVFKHRDGPIKELE